MSEPYTGTVDFNPAQGVPSADVNAVLPLQGIVTAIAGATGDVLQAQRRERRADYLEASNQWQGQIDSFAQDQEQNPDLPAFVRKVEGLRQEMLASYDGPYAKELEVDFKGRADQQYLRLRGVRLQRDKDIRLDTGKTAIARGLETVRIAAQNGTGDEAAVASITEARQLLRDNGVEENDLLAIDRQIETERLIGRSLGSIKPLVDAGQIEQAQAAIAGIALNNPGVDPLILNDAQDRVAAVLNPTLRVKESARAQSWAINGAKLEGELRFAAQNGGDLNAVIERYKGKVSPVDAVQSRSFAAFAAGELSFEQHRVDVQKAIMDGGMSLEAFDGLRDAYGPGRQKEWIADRADVMRMQAYRDPLRDIANAAEGRYRVADSEKMREAMDAYLQESGADWRSATPADVAELVRKVGIMPQSLQTSLETGMGSSLGGPWAANDEKMSQLFTALRQTPDGDQVLQRINKEAYSFWSNVTDARAMGVSDMAAVKKDAYDRAYGRGPTTADTNKISEQATSEFKSIAQRLSVDDPSTFLTETTPRGWLPGPVALAAGTWQTPANLDKMQQAYVEARARTDHLFQNKERAKEYAKELVLQQWGVSRIAAPQQAQSFLEWGTGSPASNPVVVRHPPENYWGTAPNEKVFQVAPELLKPWFENALVDAVAASGELTREEAAEKLATGKLWIADNNPNAPLPRGGPERPKYSVMFEDREGKIDFLRDEAGNEVAFQPRLTDSDPLMQAWRQAERDAQATLAAGRTDILPTAKAGERIMRQSLYKQLQSSEMLPSWGLQRWLTDLGLR